MSKIPRNYYLKNFDSLNNSDLGYLAAYKNFKPIFKPEDNNTELICDPMPEDWKDDIAKNKWWANGYTGDLTENEKQNMEIKNILLSFGGEDVCLPEIEEDYMAIKRYGQLWTGKAVKMMRGKVSQCHANSCILWEQNHSSHHVAICTGYALSKDGMWRQHSWLIWVKARSSTIIETTEPRIAYFGFVMTVPQAERFCENNE